jgi:hypothetical protein
MSWLVINLIPRQEVFGENPWPGLLQLYLDGAVMMVPENLLACSK